MSKRAVLRIALNELDEYELQGLYLTLAKEKALYLDHKYDLIQGIIECCMSNSSVEELLIEKGQKIFDLLEEYQCKKRKIVEELHKTIVDYFKS